MSFKTFFYRSLRKNIIEQFCTVPHGFTAPPCVHLSLPSERNQRNPSFGFLFLFFSAEAGNRIASHLLPEV